MKKEAFKKIKLPDNPGVYFFMHGKTLLYVGKATSLKDRVKSYFSKDLIDTRGPIILDMVYQADDIKWQTTDSVLEALILESSLIKKYQPKYNTKEKSDKSFNYVCITKEDLPKIILVRGKEINSTNADSSPMKFSNIYGPFPNGGQLREALKVVRKIFPFLDEKSKDYLDFYRQINLVPDLRDRTMYLKNIKNIRLFFSGKKKEILINLKKEMKLYVQKQEFEKAGEIKRQIFALQHINDIALIKNSVFTHKDFNNQILSDKKTIDSNMYKNSDIPFRIESYDIAHMSGDNMVGVMVVVEDGETNRSEYRKFKIKTQNNTNDTGALKEILERRIKHPEWRLPDLVVVDGSTAQINVAKKIFSSEKLSAPILAVVKDERHKPRNILGDKRLALKYEKEILLANSEAHRFAISYHKKLRNKNFLP